MPCDDESAARLASERGTPDTESVPAPPGTAPWAWEAVRAERVDGGWRFPEHNGDGEIVGRVTRFDAPRGDGPRCKAERGGKRGLCLRWPLDAYAGTRENEPVLILEGPSDTVAAVGLGFDAIGRPSAHAGDDDIVKVLAGRDAHVAIVADADEAGRKGAATLAEKLTKVCASVRIVEPRAKDLRDWVAAGATKDDVLDLIRATRVSPPASVAPTGAGSPVIVRMADVVPQPVEWLWPNRIAIGKLSILAGVPGLGKSFATLDMAARVSRGAPWPDAPDVRQEPGGVVLLSAEDGLADTIRPRLDAAGADLERIIVLEAVRAEGENGRPLERGFDLGRDLPALEGAIGQCAGCRLVVIDPLTAYLGGVDSHKNAEVRGMLAPLAALAERYRVAMVLVSHLTKGVGGPAINRVLGSIGFVGAARSAWAVGEDREVRGRRILASIKANLAPDVGGLAYRIAPCGVNGGAAVEWEDGPVDMSADEALNGPRDGERLRPQRDAAGDWLVDLLIGAGGAMPMVEVKQEAIAAGHSWATVRRAKDARGVEVRKRAFGGGWEWCLDPKNAHEGAHSFTSEHLGTSARESPAESRRRSGEHLGGASSDGERLGQEPPVPAPPGPSGSPEACRWCKVGKWWRPAASEPDAAWNCAGCHPPIAPRTAEWWEGEAFDPG